MTSVVQNSLDETLAASPANAMSELGALIDPQWIEQALHAYVAGGASPAKIFFQATASNGVWCYP
ncbi:hypothetical protein [Diaphorobacter ruginosibacter]|uniref:hypothetical protein n=1 Tax=Diaphorobacter ruginosibacter TaxID=1715720 RepID=UPI0033420F77